MNSFFVNFFDFLFGRNEKMITFAPVKSKQSIQMTMNRAYWWWRCS